MSEVEQTLRAVQPAARLVRRRLVERLRAELGAAGDPLPVWVPRDRLPQEVDAGDSPAVLLLPTPDDVVPRVAGATLLRVYWRRLVQGELLRQLAELPDATAAGRLASLGLDVAAEVRCVLIGDEILPCDASPAAVYRAFAAIGGDALAFEPERFGRLFPLLADDPATRERLAADVNLFAVRDRVRPAGAMQTAVPTPSTRGVGGFVQDVSDAARHAVRRGNKVRAAVELARAGDKAAARTLRDGLVADLARVLGWDAATAAAWDAALRPLLPGVGEADWGRSARCLYDLQRIVTDLSGEPAALDPWGWVFSLGRRPLRRPQPLTRPVSLLRHLTTAREHLHRTGLPPERREKLDGLLAHARHAVEVEVRAGCEPVVRAALTAAGLTPGTAEERVALNAVAAELVDRIAERGFARFADLRDAVARNALKLPDLSGVGEWWHGDALLRADNRLGADLDGVYQPAERYLRAVHRATAAAFGTGVGRWLSLWVLLPFGGGLMAVEFAKYVALEVSHLRTWVRGLIAREEPALYDPLADYLAQFDEQPVEKAHAELAFNGPSLVAALVLGLLFLALIHRPGFRRWLGRAVGTALGFVFVRLPTAVWQSPPVRAVLASRVMRETGSSLAVAGLAAVGLLLAGAGWSRVVVLAAVAFLLTFAGSHTPLGRRMQEETADALTDGWRLLRHNLLPGLVVTVADVFRVVADRVERALYAVDEWLRFRDRDRGPTLGIKAAAAAVWQPVAYLFRFAFYLLIEPQVNPVKHFPVVTVGHKLLLPAVPSLSGVTGLSLGTTTGLVSLVPGVFGFVAWELKESWRLYAANRPPVPNPLPVGHHGETVHGLLVPGFHRGTVPRLFARLRQATDPGPAEDGLHEVEHAVERFAERFLVAPLRDAPAWAGLSPAAGPVRLGVRTVTATLIVPELGGGPLAVTFVNDAGTVTARVEPADWQGRLTADQSAVLATAVQRFERLGGA